jgi:ferredoxin--NADP+ reductase
MLRLETAARGFFLADQLSPGEHLWMLATGTGLAPYIAMLRHLAELTGFRRLILAHSVRHANELAFADELNQLAAAAPSRFRYLPIVTRETVPGCLQGRIPALLEDDVLQAKAERPLDPAESRVMVCGNPDFTATMRAALNERGFIPCRRGLAGSMLFEKYW